MRNDYTGGPSSVILKATGTVVEVDVKALRVAVLVDESTSHLSGSTTFFSFRNHTESQPCEIDENLAPGDRVAISYFNTDTEGLGLAGESLVVIERHEEQ